jgi:hypothetical protein
VWVLVGSLPHTPPNAQYTLLSESAEHLPTFTIIVTLLIYPTFLCFVFCIGVLCRFLTPYPTPHNPYPTPIPSFSSSSFTSSLSLFSSLLPRSGRSNRRVYIYSPVCDAKSKPKPSFQRTRSHLDSITLALSLTLTPIGRNLRYDTVIRASTSTSISMSMYVHVYVCMSTEYITVTSTSIPPVVAIPAGPTVRVPESISDA